MQHNGFRRGLWSRYNRDPNSSPIQTFSQQHFDVNEKYFLMECAVKNRFQLAILEGMCECVYVCVWNQSVLGCLQAVILMHTIWPVILDSKLMSVSFCHIVITATYNVVAVTEGKGGGRKEVFTWPGRKEGEGGKEVFTWPFSCCSVAFTKLRHQSTH